MKYGLLAFAQRLEMRPRPSPDLCQITIPEHELDRGGILAHVLVEPVQLVLGLLDPADQPERVRARSTSFSASISRQAWLRCKALRLS